MNPVTGERTRKTRVKTGTNKMNTCSKPSALCNWLASMQKIFFLKRTSYCCAVQCKGLTLGMGLIILLSISIVKCSETMSYHVRAELCTCRFRVIVFAILVTAEICGNKQWTIAKAIKRARTMAERPSSTVSHAHNSKTAASLAVITSSHDLTPFRNPSSYSLLAYTAIFYAHLLSNGGNY